MKFGGLQSRELGHPTIYQLFYGVPLEKYQVIQICFITKLQQQQKGNKCISMVIILLIIEGCPDRVRSSITNKPSVPQKPLFHRFGPKFIEYEYEYDVFQHVVALSLLSTIMR